jgi:NAD dependent epimerase/dehydratase family
MLIAGSAQNDFRVRSLQNRPFHSPPRSYSDKNNLRQFITGGAGYIGSHACKALAASGFVPITYDNLSRGNRWAVKWGPLEEGDIGDAERVRVVLEKYRPTASLHHRERGSPMKNRKREICTSGSSILQHTQMWASRSSSHCYIT